MTNMQLPTMHLPRIDLPDLDVAGFVRDAAYVAVGAGVLAFQRAQVARRELTVQLDKQLAGAVTSPARLGTALEDRLQLVEERLGAVGDQLGELRDRVAAQLHR